MRTTAEFTSYPLRHYVITKKFIIFVVVIEICAGDIFLRGAF